jgi:hypothetical protein
MSDKYPRPTPTPTRPIVKGLPLWSKAKKQKPIFTPQQEGRILEIVQAALEERGEPSKPIPTKPPVTKDPKTIRVY